jgi:REP element-mobilizing transposase RayT
MKYEDEKYYHVFNRGANKETIFFSNSNYRYCLSLLEKYSEEYHVNIAAYCLMFNHYHLLLQQKMNGSIHRFLQTTFNAYSQAINKEFKRVGTLFQGRPKSKEIDDDEYLAQICRYIHLNPVSAGLVKDPIDWKFSDCSKWLRNETIYSSFNSPFFADANSYREYLSEEIAQKKTKKIIFPFDLD